MLLDEQDQKRLAEKPKRTCRECREVLIESYCRDCDEFFAFGHKGDCKEGASFDLPHGRHRRY